MTSFIVHNVSRHRQRSLVCKVPQWSVRVNQKCIPISSPVFAFTFTGIVIKPPKMIAPAGSALYRRGPVKAGASWRCLGSGKVLVNYVDGDLDRPMVTGIVYNGENPPPYRLPDHINYSGFVSRSLRFGQPQHASQLTFDDNRGNERIMLHAERDLQRTVERNSATAVGQDKYDTVERTATGGSTTISPTKTSVSR